MSNVGFHPAPLAILRFAILVEFGGFFAYQDPQNVLTQFVTIDMCQPV